MVRTTHRDMRWLRLTKGSKIRCPVCNKTHYWYRRQVLVWNENKSIKLRCMNCGSEYWARKVGIRTIITKERDDD